MATEKKITVVVPVYNREKFIARTLDSIAAQTRLPGRVIIVDNASTDSSHAVAKEWAAAHNSPDFRVDVLQETTPGAWAARNKGLEAVDSEWVSFFDSDDLMAPDFIEEVAANTDDADIVYWKMAYRSGQDVNVERFSRFNPVRRHLINSLLGTLRFMVRTDFIRQAGGWPDVRVWDDWLLGLKLLGRNPRMKPIDKVLSEAIVHSDSITGLDYSHKAGQWEKTLDRAASLVTEDSGQSTPLRWKGHSASRMLGMIDYRRVILAALYTKEGRPDLGKTLLEKTLRESHVASWRKLLLRFIYIYTARGGRAAYLLWH